MIFLIFFTSLGSAVASDELMSDNMTSDITLDDSLTIESEDFDVSEISDDSDSFKRSDNNLFDSDSLESSDESNLIDLVNDNEKTIDSYDSNDMNIGSHSKKSLSSVDDSRKVNSNDLIILSNSKSSNSVFSSPELVVIEDAGHYGDSANTIIQGIIDKARAGSTIQFAGSSYENIYLRISKPLNIISKSGTVINNIFNIPVFTIEYGGSGTNISGFTVNTSGSFVDARDVSEISISKNTISTKRTAIILNEVYDSVIGDNVFLRFDTAIDISNSGGVSISKNNITPENSYNTGINIKSIVSKKGIHILNNNIIGFDSKKTCTGIFFGKDSSNVYLKGNVIRKWYTAIEMPYSVNNVSMYNNTITNNGDGIIINGWINNFTFKKNLVNNNARVGILFDDNFKGTKGKLDLENNYFSYNGVLDLQNKGDKAVSIGKNFAKNKCSRVGMKYGFKIRSRQSGGKYYFSVVDKYGNSISDLPNFSAKLTVNGKSYVVTFIDGKAYINGVGGKGGSSTYLDVGEDNRDLNQWGQFEEIDSDEMSYYEEIFNQLAGIAPQGDDFDGSDDYSDEYNNESGSGSGSGSGDSGLSNGANSINANGVLSGSSGLAGSPSVASSPSASPSSSPSSAEDAASIKTLSVDEETFRVVGVAGLVLLIILVIGLYYREDILEMMEEE